MENPNEWYNAIGNVGFPIVIAIYLLIRFEKKIEILRQSIDQLGQVIQEYTRER